MESQQPIRILQVYRDPLEPGREAEYRVVESDAAQICCDSGCPHPHAAIELLSGPAEVWWLNGFASEADRQGAVGAYAANTALMSGLQGISQRRIGLVRAPVEQFLTYRPELSRGPAWTMVGTRFVAVTLAATPGEVEGSAFEANNGTVSIWTAAATVEPVNALAARVGAMVFAVRPYWGMPAREWIAADPVFWGANPAARPPIPSDG